MVQRCTGETSALDVQIPLLLSSLNAGAPVPVAGRDLSSPTFWEFGQAIIRQGGGSSPWFSSNVAILPLVVLLV